MGASQRAKDVSSLIEKSLGIDASHLRASFSDKGCTASCLVHESWLKEIISSNHGNISKYSHPSSEYERQLMLQPSHTGPYPPWVRVCIRVLQKPILVGNPKRSISLKTENQTNDSEVLMDLTVAELMQVISKDIYRYNWSAAIENYSLAMSYLPKSQRKQFDGQEIIRQLVQNVFGLSVIPLGKKKIKAKTSEIHANNTHRSLSDSESITETSIELSNVVPMVCVLENDEAFFFVEPFFRHGLQDISTFSPGVVSHSTSHLLYVIYQALHGLNWFHQHGVAFGRLDLDSIRLDSGLFLYLTTPSFEDLSAIPSFCDHKSGESSDNATFPTATIGASSSLQQGFVKDEFYAEDYSSISDLQKPEYDLVTLVEMWVRDEISNYDYLMALNYFAGRRHGDPNYHPLFPWVTDFTTKDGGYRDLTRSKFRLNKGDSQLDMTYKQALYDTHEGGTTAVAHHVSDVLSDITFHAYLARRTPVSVLCEHLRSNWVPNEYPSTMERLYSWTPDECIPQFFSDPTIFKSIHRDLPDLELPSWTPTADEFIQWHRSVLESEEVSRNLHQWIDLTFGYKLSGKAAIRAKNVCLHLVNKQHGVNNYGVVQLFNRPHPAQSKPTDLLKLISHQLNEVGSGSLQPFSMIMSAYLKSNRYGSMISLDSIDDINQSIEVQSVEQPQSGSSKEVTEDNSKITEAEKIFLPDDCNPVRLLETFESIQKFKRQFPVKPVQQNSIERPEVFMKDLALDKLIQHDIEALGSMIVEMVLPDKVRLVSAGLSQEQKVVAIKTLCASNPKILPRYLRSGLERMLNLPASPDNSINEHSNLHNWIDDGNTLPSLSTGLILHPQTGIFPFPSYFKQLHSFLVQFTQARLKDRYHSPENLGKSFCCESFPRISLEGLEHCFSNKSEYSTGQIDIAIEVLPSLLPDLDEEGKSLLLYHLEPLFTNYETRLYAFTHLFDTLAQCLGPKSTLKTFMKPLIELCDSRLLQNYEHLVAQSFLSQIIVRFGLEVFLAHFVNFVVDAVAFELMLEKTKRSGDRISVHSNEGIIVDGGETLTEKSKPKSESPSKRSLYITDEEYEGTAYAPYSDHEDDDLFDEQNGISERLFTCDDEDKDDPRDDGSTSDRESSHLSVLCKEVSSDLNEDDDVDVGDSDSGSRVMVSAVIETAAAEAIKRDTDKGEDNTKGDKDEEQRDTDKGEDNTKGDKDEDQSKDIEERDKENIDDDQALKWNETEKVDEKTAEELDEYSETGKDSAVVEFGDQAKEQEAPEDTTSSGSLSDNEEPGDFTDTRQIDPPSADVFYQDTKPAVTKGSDKAEELKEELSPSYVSGIAAESVMWLAPRLGPILTSQYLAKQLLTMLPQCYMDVVGVAEFENEDEDRKAKWVLYSLGNFCALYGEAFVLYQYLPFAEKIIKSIHEKITARGEASLAAVFALIKYCIPYMSKETLLQNFETLFKTVFQPVLRILSSCNTKFPGGGDARATLCHNYVDLLTVLSLKLERELARELMTAPLQQFFSCFELVHMKKKEIKLGRTSFISVSSSVNEDDDEGKEIPKSPVLEGGPINPEQIEVFYKTSMYEQLCQTFSAAMAHHAYVPLCGIMGSKYMESALFNHDLIWNLCCSHDTQLSHPGTDDVSESRDTVDELPKPDDCDAEVEKVLGEGLKNVDENETEVEGKTNSLKRVSSRIRTPSWLSGKRAEKRKSQDLGCSKPEVVSASDQYLRGSWLDLWKYQIQSSTRSHRSRFSLQQIKLQTFTGHSGPVRSIYVQDSEHFFLSASKDKTVKLWSLSNHGDGTAQSASSWTYYRHSRGVFAVDMVESVRQAVSCDGSVHIWDPIHGSTISVLEPNKNSSIVAMVAMPAPSQSVVVATSEGTARFIDVRQSCFAHEWKTTTSSAAGSVRDLCCSPDGRWIALGFSSGLVSVLDVRGGLLRSQRRAHTSDVVQVRAFSNNSLFTSSMDQGLALWKDDGLRLKNIKGHTEPLNLLLVQQDYIISSSIANRIGIHELIDDPSEGSYTSYKLTQEVFRGNLTSLGYLQLNQLLLLGSDTGNISLCA